MTGGLPEAPPFPPFDLKTRRPHEVILPKGEVLHRFYAAAFDPIFYDGGPDGRFNAPGAGYGVLYAAKSVRGAFAETFLRVPGRTLLPMDLIAKKAYVTLTLSSPLRLVKMAGPGLVRIGATAQVPHGGKPYDCPQAWSKDLHAHPGNYDGIAYNARHDDDELCYAIFDRAAAHVSEAGRVRSLDQDWFWEVADVYDVGLAPGPPITA